MHYGQITADVDVGRWRSIRSSRKDTNVRRQASYLSALLIVSTWTRSQWW